MMIGEVARDEKTVAQLVDLWEASVRETHDFLLEEDVLSLQPQVEQALKDIEQLYGFRDEQGVIIGFSGVENGKLEMLFIAPEARGKGMGKRLVEHAVSELGITKVDVNEQIFRQFAFTSIWVLLCLIALRPMSRVFPSLFFIFINPDHLLFRVQDIVNRESALTAVQFVNCRFPNLWERWRERCRGGGGRGGPRRSIPGGLGNAYYSGKFFLLPKKFLQKVHHGVFYVYSNERCTACKTGCTSLTVAFLFSQG